MDKTENKQTRHTVCPFHFAFVRCTLLDALALAAPKGAEILADARKAASGQ